jgi:hypothetical protein
MISPKESRVLLASTTGNFFMLHGLWDLSWAISQLPAIDTVVLLAGITVQPVTGLTYLV